MNAYLSREEKENYIRATALAAQLELTIDSYASAKSTDPQFLKYLRMGRTMLTKALTMRSEALDLDTKNEFVKQVSRLQLICVATQEAKKAHQELLALKTTLPMELQDFEDWYESVIETTCKTCLREDFTDCKTRRVLIKYGVYPIDPEGKNKCQYSYVGTPDAEELQPVDDEMVPARIYNQAVAEFVALNTKVAGLEERLSEYDWLKSELNVILHPNGDGPANPSMCDIVAYIRRDWDRFAKEAQELRKQLEDLQGRYDVLTESSGVAQESGAAEEDLDLDCEDDGLPVTLVLNNGLKTIMHLPKHMTECLIAEIKRPSRFSRSICAKFVDDEFVAIDMQEVVAMYVSGLANVEWAKPRVVQTQSTSTNEQERYRIECSCGAEYFANMYNGFPGGRTKGRCRECQNTVFADRQVDKIPDLSDGVGATLLTNRYFVIREPYQVREEDAPVSSPITPKSRELNVAPDLRNIKNIGSDYKDPCRLLG